MDNLSTLKAKFPTTRKCKDVAQARQHIRALHLPWGDGKRSQVADRLAITIAGESEYQPKSYYVGQALAQWRSEVGQGKFFQYGSTDGSGSKGRKSQDEQLKAFLKDLNYVYKEDLRISK